MNTQEQWGLVAYRTIATPQGFFSIVPTKEWEGTDSDLWNIAKLCAAAPEMFQALQAICDAFGDQDSLLIDQCKAALAKAKGEA